MYAGDLESLQNRAGMRPIITQSLRDDEITLHDNVFMDNSEHEPKLEKIRKLHEEVHCKQYTCWKAVAFQRLAREANRFCLVF